MMNIYGSHRFVVEEILKRVTKPVLELGAGDFSTVQIHEALKNKKISITTIDDSEEWLNKYCKLESKLHKLLLKNDEGIREFYKNDSTKYGLVFIDLGKWELRVDAVMKYKNVADYIILHDCNYYPDNGIFGKTIKKINVAYRIKGVRNYSDVFKYWIEFFMKDWNIHSPPTLLGSNKICLDNINISGMEAVNRNK